MVASELLEQPGKILGVRCSGLVSQGQGVLLTLLASIVRRLDNNFHWINANKANHATAGE